MVIALYTKTHASEKTKHFLFFAIAIPVVIATLYLGGATVYLNLVSETGGPIHWHADIEVWVCDEKYELKDPEGFDNRLGPVILHEHNDNRLHVEGLLLDIKQVSLGEFFQSNWWFF